ncbi:MAG: hypothetical protein ACREUA_07710 [Burkholderiales bacterium]
MLKLIASASLCAVLGGCGHLLPQKKAEPSVNLAGFPPEYRSGYVDGCTSGKHQAGDSGHAFTKDLQRFKSDTNYAMGWNDGFEICQKQL